MENKHKEMQVTQVARRLLLVRNKQLKLKK